ncbi:conserved domain protein, partial [Ureaplasma urealyticum serovar 13 str. ATCC 33698]|uniref:hypothetical protein n=1 Tax=Ureaplasma urealyticum TaxID=2130 RepID=UPI00016BFBBD
KQKEAEDNFYQTMKNDFEIGERIVHTSFGNGVIIGIDGDILSEDLSATLVYESNDPHDLQSYTTKLKKVNNDWVIDFNLNNLKPQ